MAAARVPRDATVRAETPFADGRKGADSAATEGDAAAPEFGPVDPGDDPRGGLRAQLAPLLQGSGLDPSSAPEAFLAEVRARGALPLADQHGWGARSAENLFAAIREKARIPLARLIFALGIRHVGEGSAGLLARSFGTWPAFRAAMEAASDPESADWEALNAIDGVGTVMAGALVDFFQDPDH
ncbi:MAG: helix-hairpin-helix domain-containing protein, partial [Pseudomonadota bacterium]